MKPGARANLWIMGIAGTAGGVVLVWALAAEAMPVARDQGWAALLADATFQHKVGELMIAAPLFMAAFVGQSRGVANAARLLWRAWPLTILGALLNGLAWIGAAQNSWLEPNRLWFSVLVLVGLAAPPLLARWLRRRERPA